MQRWALPSRFAPEPDCATATSPAQITTGVPGSRPVCAAASGVTSPITCVEGKAGGNFSTGMPSRAQTSSSQVFL